MSDKGINKNTDLWNRGWNKYNDYKNYYSNILADDLERARTIGKVNHPLYEEVFRRFMIYKHLLTEKEIELEKYSNRENENDEINTKHQMDVWLKLLGNKNIMTFETENENLDNLKSNRFKEMALVFTTLSSEDFDNILSHQDPNFRYVLDKLRRFYQNDECFLVIVIYGKVSSKTMNILNKKIKKHPLYNNNVAAVTLETFIEFFKISGKYRNDLLEIESLSTRALSDDEAFEDLMEWTPKSFTY